MYAGVYIITVCTALPKGGRNVRVFVMTLEWKEKKEGVERRESERKGKNERGEDGERRGIGKKEEKGN